MSFSERQFKGMIESSLRQRFKALKCASTAGIVIHNMCDDQGFGTIIGFVRIFGLDDKNNPVIIGDYNSDFTEKYTPTGTVTQCDDVGEYASLQADYTVLTDVDSWEIPAGTTQVTVNPVTVGGTPTLLTENGTSNLIQGVPLTWEIGFEGPMQLVGPFTVTSTSGDTIAINWSSYGSTLGTVGSSAVAFWTETINVAAGSHVTLTIASPPNNRFDVIDVQRNGVGMPYVDDAIPGSVGWDLNVDKIEFYKNASLENITAQIKVTWIVR